MHRVLANSCPRGVAEVIDAAVAVGEVVDAIAKDAVIASVMDGHEVELNIRNARERDAMGTRALNRAAGARGSGRSTTAAITSHLQSTAAVAGVVQNYSV